MGETRKEVQASGLGFFGALALLFIGLKLGAVIDWSWWWVLCPLWGPFAAVFLGMIVGFFGVIIWAACEEFALRRERRRKRDRLEPEPYFPTTGAEIYKRSPWYR